MSEPTLTAAEREALAAGWADFWKTHAAVTDIVAARVAKAVDQERAAWVTKIETLVDEMKEWPDADGDGWPVRAHEVRGDVMDCLRGLLVAADDTEAKP